MAQEKSCGAVVFTKINNEIKYLLVRNLAGTYGFPKGHVEHSETEEETAHREILEEVGLRVELIPGFRSEEEYALPDKKDTRKRVVYFLGEYSDLDFTYQKEELSGAFLLSYGEAMDALQFESSRRILTEANDFLFGK